MSSDGEMNLEQWVAELPDFHLAAKEYRALLTEGRKAFMAGYSAGFSACCAGSEGLPSEKERDYEVFVSGKRDD